ncbi:MAG: amino acid-binding protein [Propionibacteriales bacterium]|nr:amino acid-binding protein [Propionibacteriales bacterium]
MHQLAITVLGHDRPGIIAQTAAALSDLGMNLEDSSMTLLRGHFAMTLVCSGEADAQAVESALFPLVDGSLDVSVRSLSGTDERVAPGVSSLLVSVHGGDRLGIVSRVAGVIGDAGGNITDLTTRLAGGLYVLAAEVDVPDGVDVDAFIAKLAQTGQVLGVDVRVQPLDRDEL